MELSQIRYFLAAARQQNLSKAAVFLNITQPTLSKSISNLEEELGVLLFDRRGKKLKLNECGKGFLENAEISMRELENAVAEAKNTASSPAMYLGLFHCSERFLMCLGDFSKANPGVIFQTDQLAIPSRNIDTDEFDMLLYPGNPIFRKYKGDIAYSDPYRLAVHKSDPLAGRQSVILSDISDRKLIVIKHAGIPVDLPRQMCANRGVRIRETLFTNSYEAQRLLISCDCGVGFVPAGWARAYAADPNITLLPVDEDKLKQDILIGFKREKHLSADGRRFAAFVRNYFGIKTPAATGGETRRAADGTGMPAGQKGGLD